MQVVIDMDDNLYTRLFDNGKIDAVDMLKVCAVVRKGAPIPKGHGDLIDRYNLLDNAGRYNYKNFQVITVARIMAENVVVPADKEVD